MALSVEQRKRMRSLLFHLDPAEGNEELIERVEEFNSFVKDIFGRLSKLQNEVSSMFAQKEKEYFRKMKDMELDTETRLSRHRELTNKGLDELDKSVKETNRRIDQVRTEVTDNIRISYSKMGGGTMPVLLQKEIPTYQSGPNQGQPFVPDGVTAVYTFYNLPVLMNVGGGIMTAGDGYEIAPLGSSVWQVTFDNAPGQGQSVYSFHY